MALRTIKFTWCRPNQNTPLKKESEDDFLRKLDSICSSYGSVQVKGRTGERKKAKQVLYFANFNTFEAASKMMEEYSGPVCINDRTVNFHSVQTAAIVSE